MGETILDFLSPSEIYGKILAKLIRATRASLASLWTSDRGKTFLYASVGDKCDRLQAALYDACEKEASEAIKKGISVSSILGENELFAVPIFEDSEAYACALLLSEDKRRFDEERRELAKKETSSFADILSLSKLKRPEFLFAPICMTLRNVSINSTDGDETVPVLNSINLSIRKEELMVVIGTSGSGKTTLLNVLGGLIKPTSGSVFAEDFDLVHSGDNDISRFRKEKISFLFQFFNLVPELTAAENVSVTAKLKKNAVPVLEALRQVGMEAKADRYPYQLSKEEQQRVALARAIAKDPDFLLCDEPIGALSADAGERILTLLTDIIKKTGLTVIIVTHCAAIASIADRVVRLKSGHIAEEYVNAEKLSPDEIVW